MNLAPNAGWSRLARLLPLLLLALLPAAPARAAQSVSLTCLPDTVVADEDGAWRLSIGVSNRTGFGLYGDSLTLVIHPTGAGRAEAVIPLVVPPTFAEIGSGDSVTAIVTAVASARSARLEVRFRAHGHDAGDVSLQATATAAGQVLESRFPAETLRLAGHDVDVVRVPGAEGPASGWGLLLLAGEDPDAIDTRVNALRLARRGYTTLIVAGAGPGRGAAPDDFAGKASLDVARAALDTLARTAGVDPGKLAVWGVSRGGTLALRLAAARPEPLRCVIAESAFYDLWAAFRAADPGGRKAIVAAAGSDSAGWQERSPLAWKGTPVHAPLLVVHAEDDEVSPVSAARAFAARAESAGVQVTSRFAPRGGHAVRSADAVRFLVQNAMPKR